MIFCLCDTPFDDGMSLIFYMAKLLNILNVPISCTKLKIVGCTLFVILIHVGKVHIITI